MAKIDLTLHPERLENTIKRARERNIIIPTFAQMRNPDLAPEKIKQDLKSIGLWELNPRNLFRITWKNEPKETGGGFGNVNYLELPKSLTGVMPVSLFSLANGSPRGHTKLVHPLAALFPDW